MCVIVGCQPFCFPLVVKMVSVGGGFVAAILASSVSGIQIITLSDMPLRCKEHGKDDDHMVTITSVDDLAAYCLVHHLQHNGGQMDLGRAGQFFSEELTPRISVQIKSRVKAIIQAHDDNLCYSAPGNSISLRRGWPYPSLPVEDVQPTELEEEAEDLDEASVDQTLAKRVPVTVRLLRDATSLYLKHRLDLKLHKGALSKKPNKSDPEKLAKSFSESVRQHGILRLEVLLAEIDHACNVRRISPDSRLEPWVAWVAMLA